MGNSATKEKIERAKKLGSLTLSDGLDKIPESAFALSNLITLNLSENKLKVLPPQLFTSFPKLRHLTLSSNALVAIPPDISKLTKLETLNLSHNRITAAGVASQIWSLPKLKTLELNHNRLEVISLPTEAVERKGAPDVGKALEVLDVSHNQLVALPPALNALDRLQELNAQHNRITKLFQNWSGLQKLRVLRVTANPLEELPPSLLQETNVGLIEFEQTPVFERQKFHKEDAYAAYATRRKQLADRGLQAGLEVRTS